MAFLSYPDIQTENETPPLLTPEDLTYRGLIRQIALTVIKKNSVEFAKLPWLKDSPIIDVAPYIKEVDKNSSMTGISENPVSPDGNKLFSIAFQQFCKLAHLDPKDIPIQVTRGGLEIIKNFLVRPSNTPSTSFEQTFITDQQKAIESRIPPENSITRENGVHWQNCEWGYVTKEGSAKKMQQALAVALVYLLRNQANMAGHINHNTPSLEDKEYAKFIKNKYFKQVPNSHPPKLKIHWDILAPGPLGTELKRLMPDIPEYSDNEVSDMTAYFPDGSAVPAVNHPDFDGKGANALTIPLLHPNGRHYLLLGVKDILSMSPTKLGEIFSYPTQHDLNYTWQPVSELLNSTNYPFAMRMDWTSHNHPVLPFEHNITNFLNLTCDPTEKRAKLEWRSGHFPSDGAIRNDALQSFSQLIKDDVLPPQGDFVQRLRTQDKPLDIATIQKAKSLKELVEMLALGKIIVGSTHDSKALEEVVAKYNNRFSEPRNVELALFIKNNNSINSSIVSLLHKYSNILETKQPSVKAGEDAIAQRYTNVINQIGAVLNPNLSSVDVIAIASEDTCPSATCALPVSRLSRLVTYAADRIDTAVRTIKSSIDLTVTERVLSRLGHGWQSNISVATKNKERFSQQAARRTSQIAAQKSSPPRQISLLGPGVNNNFFVTALSAKIDELSAGIGIFGDYITERVDLEKPDFISSLPLHKSFMDVDIKQYAKLYGYAQKDVSQFLTEINKLLIKNDQRDPLVILKSIAELNPSNPSLIIEHFLIANIYRELSLIPMQAIGYVNKAIFGQ